ncbi:MAG: ABC transporter ATP-binding protein [Lachnospiraceae bacterium]|nr:ABC transporter ATP-binding protein [Lachnospiraceae bacterium]MBR3278019.1 ABC transporter ATP-binding protein [Lachnospiraceae bacterium]
MENKKDFTKSDLSVFVSYIIPHKKLFAVDMLLSILIAGVDLTFPFITRTAMNRLLPQKLYTAFFAVMGIVLLAYVLRAVFQYYITVIGHGYGTLVEADMRADIFAHMQKLSFSFFDRNRTGMLLGRVTNDLFEIVELAHHGPENILTCTLTIIGAITILLFINPKLTMVLIVLLPLTIFYSMRQRLSMRNANKEVKKKTGEINAAIESGISGIRTSKAFANESVEEDKFNLANENFKKSRVGYYKAMGRFMGGMEAAISLMQVSVIAVGGAMIMNGELDIVDLLTFTLYVSTFTSPVRKLTQFMEIYTSGTAGFSRFLEIMRTEPEIKDAPDAVELHDARGRITYENVCFHYKDGTDVLRNVSVNVEPGQTLALVGSSGGGKTTMCHLLPRFYDVSSGSVKIDGIDVKKITQESLRKNIGIIQQDVFMFAGTVMENIRYGRPDASDKEVINAAINAEIHEEIMSFHDGYYTYVGERGVVLSGGQKQRISIARVFLKAPPILILDEATSALDSVTERRIQESLDLLSHGRTCIVIAHRLSTIRNADQIAVIENQGISEIGTRKELLARGGVYASLERAQEIGD